MTTMAIENPRSFIRTGLVQIEDVSRVYVVFQLDKIHPNGADSSSDGIAARM